MTVATMSSAQIAAADKAEAEQQRLEGHAQAANDLAAVNREWDSQVPPLELAAKSTKSKLDRAEKALDAARVAHDEAARQHDLVAFRLSDRRDRALRLIAANADPAWDLFVAELREAGAKALASRYDLTTGPGPFGPQSVDRSRVEHNARARSLWQSCQATIDKVRSRKADPKADAETEIPKLRDALPTL